MRVGEVLELRWGDVTLDAPGVKRCESEKPGTVSTHGRTLKYERLWNGGS
jgi:hypothetical protein